MIAFYFDQHVPSAIARGARRLGIDVLTALEDGRSDARDEELLARATQLGRVIVTCDDDFLVLAEDWLDAGKTFAGVVYGHQLRLTIGRTIRDLELVAGASTAEELRDQIVFLPL